MFVIPANILLHIPDGFLHLLVSAVCWLISLVVLGMAVANTRRDLDERLIPLAGIMAAFIFAAQMLNFPVVSGTSGHLLGGCLAAILVGPYLGALAVSVVLLVQALLFADGGLSALGTNIVLIALVPAFLGYALFRWAAAQGFYGLALPGGLAGLGAGVVRNRSILVAIACGLFATALGVFAEYRFAPFAADPSFSFFLAHLADLSPVTVVMIALGGVIGFWVPFRRKESGGRVVDGSRAAGF